MEKLVRDKIPQIVAKARGVRTPFRIAGRAKYSELLRQKLEEEVAEYLASGDPKELADILEVVYHLAEVAGLSPEKLEEMRRRKSDERGGFKDRKVMDF